MGDGGAAMLQARKIDYFYTTATERTGATMLDCLARNKVNLLAYNATPTGPTHTLCAIFPENSELLIQAAQKEGLSLEGPHHALLVEGEDQIGALERIYRALHDASVDVYASTAIRSREGSFGCLLYVRPGDVDRGLSALTNAS